MRHLPRWFLRLLTRRRARRRRSGNRVRRIHPDPDKLKVVIYPVMAWAPILGGNVRIPDTPSTPGGGSLSTNSSLNSAALFGFTIQKNRWYGVGNVMWAAGMDTSRTSPHVSVNINGVYGSRQIGYRVPGLLFDRRLPSPGIQVRRYPGHVSAVRAKAWSLGPPNRSALEPPALQEVDGQGQCSGWRFRSRR
jgi:hypothetical protein